MVELASGKPLFPAECERELLQLMMQVKGRVPEEMLEKSIKKNKFFSQGLILPDKYGNILQPGSKKLEEIIEGETIFLDFIEGCLEWDPAFRMTAQQALDHPWLRQEEKSKKAQILKLLRRSKFFKK
jgi:dual specificity tyrosine-phosphorylation-regulated kinase 2/3/4